MLLLDPSLIPDPCLTAIQEKGAPDNIYLAFYTVHEAQDNIHWWCKDSIIECHTSPQTLSMGDKQWENWAHSQTTGTQGPHYEI